ncbi:hypothetical protein ACFLTZ_00745 [Chloroflexota bacterium]
MKGSDLFLIGLAIWSIYEIDKNNARTPTASPVLHIDFDRICKEALDKVFRKCEPVLTNTIEAPLIKEPTALSVPPDNTAIEASKWLALIKHPVIIVILGKKGSGKSALGYRILEYFRWTLPVYVVGLPADAHKFLADWIGVKPALKEVPPDSIVMVDESYILHHARSSMTAQAKALSEMLNLSRQRNQTLVFVSQESRQIDRNILSSADVIIFKEPGILQPRFDRPELRDIAREAKLAFATVSGDKRNWSYVYSPNADYIGLLENKVPTFWNQKLSRAFACNTNQSSAKTPKNMTDGEKMQKAKELNNEGWSQGKLANYFGISKGTIFNWIHDYPYRSN